VVAVVGVVLLVECADPREDEQVSAVTSCAPDAGVFERLSTAPSSPESSVVAYVNAAESLVTKTAQMNQLLIDGCNDVDTELGIATGTDLETACQPLAQLASTVVKNQPPASSTGPAVAPWFGMTVPPVCTVDPNARATCLNSCSAGQCDNTHCSAGQLQGTCNGTCVGDCVVTADPDAGTPCVGQCRGLCSNLTADGGAAPNACTGECNGVCGGQTANGFCAKGCGNAASSSSLFTGECDGTCTGSCDGNPINGGVPDGGLGPEAGLPNNADGNCKGLCVGWCSSNAYGGCPFPCAGPSFKGGVCSPGTCISTCISGTGAGCSGSCDGTCTSSTGDAGATCSGVCLGTCNGTLTNPTCGSTLACGQNTECNDACEAASGATVTCGVPGSLEVETLSNLKLYNALKAKGQKIGEALQMLALLRSAEGFVDNRQLSDFAAIGASGEVVRACFARGQTAVKQASANIAAASAADPTAVN
jgi:hypothetical protein